MIAYGYFYPAEALALGVVLVLLWRRRVPPWAAWLALAGAAAALMVRMVVFAPTCWDLVVFWHSGRALWEGTDPYVIAGLQYPVVNPPTALPLFALFGLASFQSALVGWTALNILGCVALVPVAWMALRARADGDGWGLSRAAVAALAAAVVFSDAGRLGLYAGQFATAEALLLFGALWAQGRGRPVLAGVLLALGTVKTATLLPFLLLFLRRQDLRTWVALGATSLLLCLLASSPADLLPRCRQCLANISATTRPGAVNDYAFGNNDCHDIISLDHLYYRLGLRDRGAIQGASLATLGLLGTGLAWLVLLRRLSRPAACALAACFSMLFLYHRHYDAVVLALPLVFAAGRAVAVSGKARWPYVASVLALLVVLYLPDRVLEFVFHHARGDGPAARLVQGGILPLADWLVLLTTFTLAVAEYRRHSRLREGDGRKRARGEEEPAEAGVPGLLQPVAR